MFRASHPFRFFLYFSNYQTGDTVMLRQDYNVFIFPLVSFARPQQAICENGHCYHTFFGFVCSSLLESMPGPRQIEVEEILIFLFFKIHFVDRLLVNRFLCLLCFSGPYHTPFVFNCWWPAGDSITVKGMLSLVVVRFLASLSILTKHTRMWHTGPDASFLETCKRN
jgi:hypothetical protein